MVGINYNNGDGTGAKMSQSHGEQGGEVLQSISLVCTDEHTVITVGNRPRWDGRQADQCPRARKLFDGLAVEKAAWTG